MNRSEESSENKRANVQSVRSFDSDTWLSVCCGVQPLGELGPPMWIRVKPHGKAVKMATGTCSRCKEHTTFEKEEDDS